MPETEPESAAAVSRSERRSSIKSTSLSAKRCGDKPGARLPRSSSIDAARLGALAIGASIDVGEGSSFKDFFESRP